MEDNIDRASSTGAMNVVAEKVCDSSGGFEDEEAATGIQFYPPLYIQRYSLALNVLTEHKVKSVIDFGCAECSFFKLLPTVPDLEHIALVDIDRELLVKKKRAICPETRHFIFPRSKPLHVSLLAGSAADLDRRVQECEAVTMIEVIEHMHLEVLEKVTLNVFGNIRPKLCIVTTPNSEFNVLFENSDPTQFRHWDHKFEWTRQEFQEWCAEICETYGYSVEYTGVGNVPLKPESVHLGPCSQAAVFTLQEDKKERLQSVTCTECYELIAESEFPYREDLLTLEEKIDFEVKYILRQWRHSRLRDDDDDEPRDSVEFQVSRLAGLSGIKALCDESGVRESLKRCSYRLSADGLCVIIDKEDELERDFNDDEESYDQDLDEDLDNKINSDSQGGTKNAENSGTNDDVEDWDAECS